MARLTTEQIARMPEFVEKWTRIALSTEPGDASVAEECIAAIYASIGEARPHVVWLGSPMTAAAAGAQSRDTPLIRGSRGRANVWHSMQLILLRYLLPRVTDGWDLRSEEMHATGSDPGLPVPFFPATLRSLSRLGVGTEDWWARSGRLRTVSDRVSRLVRERVSSAYLQHGEHAQQEADALARCDHYRNACGLEEETEPLVPLMLLAQHATSWIMLESACFLSHKPTRIRVNHSGLHCDGGPAALYPDGWAVWALNGVGVPQWLAEQRAEDIDPSRLVEIENAEVRREFVRKVGLERILYKMKARILDKQGDYELVLLELGDDRRRPYLKMLNPSIGVWHAEGVLPICKTVAEALAWRNGTAEIPVALT